MKKDDFRNMHDARTPCLLVVSRKFPKEGSPVPIPRDIELLSRIFHRSTVEPGPCW